MHVMKRTGHGPAIRSALVCVAGVVALALSGCSSSGGDDTTGSAPVETTAAAAAATGAPISADALCAHLKEELPRIKAVGSEVGAMAQLTISIANLYEDHLPELDGNVLDAQATKTCPQTRTEILKAAGVDSFTDL
jgi:hypothetical protein